MSVELSLRIRSQRKIKGYTQSEFAKLLGVVQTTVANYERGIRLPDTQKLQRIADLFEVTVDYMLGRENENTGFLINESKINTVNSISFDDSCRVFLDLLLEGHRDEAINYINKLYKEGVSINNLYFEVLGRVMSDVGALWDRGNIDVWKEHYISETVMDIMRELKVKERNDINKTHSVLALTAGAELHNIGLKMLTNILELNGCDVTYIGSNVPVQSIIQAIKIKMPHIIAISVTMPYHIEAAKNTILAIKNRLGSKAPSIIVGGKAFSNCKDVCEETGADYYGVTICDILNVIENRVK